MADIQQNSGGNGSGSAITAIVAILVIVIIGFALWFGFRGKAAPSTGGANINVTLPAGSGGQGGATY